MFDGRCVFTLLPKVQLHVSAETYSCTLGSNVNTHLPSNKQVVLD